MVDAEDLKSSDRMGRTGSSPVLGIKRYLNRLKTYFIGVFTYEKERNNNRKV